MTFKNGKKFEEVKVVHLCCFENGLLDSDVIDGAMLQLTDL